MEVRPDRARFWRPWRRRALRLGIIVPAALMVTLLLAVIDWSPLRAVHLGWLLTIAVVLLWVLWLAVAFVFVSLAFVIVALRVERVVLDGGLIRRHLVLGRRMEVPVEGASLTRRASSDVVSAAGTKKRVLVPHLFYAPGDLDRLWQAAGLSQAP